MKEQRCPKCRRADISTRPSPQGDRFRIHTGRYGEQWCRGSRALVETKEVHGGTVLR